MGIFGMSSCGKTGGSLYYCETSELLFDIVCYYNFHIPADYSRTTLRADVCVVQLRVAVLVLPNVARACLPGEAPYPDPSLECFVASWGFVSTGEVSESCVH